MSAPNRPPLSHAEPPPTRGDRVRAALHRALPTQALTWAVRPLAHSRRPWLKDRLNTLFARRYGLDLSEAEATSPTAYTSLNALFTRALRPGARPLPRDPNTLAGPCDGTVSAVGSLDGDGLLQAKGVTYSATELLAGLHGDEFRDGAYLTTYLAPQDYHRIHAPLSARLAASRHVPGRLLTVGPSTARAVPRLYLRNERLVTLWQTAVGPMAIVLVGATNVGTIETTWDGPTGNPPRIERQYGRDGPYLLRGDELGRFNLGSTVILLLPRDALIWSPLLRPGRRIRTGEPLGALRATADSLKALPQA